MPIVYEQEKSTPRVHRFSFSHAMDVLSES